MACAFFSHSEGLPNAGALDLSRKPAGCTAYCQCLTCIFNRFNVPEQARNILLQQWPKHNFQQAPLPPLNFDHNANHFKSKGKEDTGTLMETRKTFEQQHNLSKKVCKTFESVPAASLQQSPEHFAYLHNEYTMKSPHSTRSLYGSSPVNKCFRSLAFPGTHPDASVNVHESFNPSAFSPCLPMGMISPNQLSLNAWWTLNHPPTSPTTTRKSSPDRAASGVELGEVMRSDSSSPATCSLGSLGTLGSLGSPESPSLSLLPKQQVTVTPIDKDSLYMQKRLKNNLAAKRSRDLRRQREDRIAADCQRMHHVLNRVKLIRSSYLGYLAAGGNNHLLDRSQAIYRV